MVELCGKILRKIDVVGLKKGSHAFLPHPFHSRRKETWLYMTIRWDIVSSSLGLLVGVFATYVERSSQWFCLSRLFLPHCWLGRTRIPLQHHRRRIPVLSIWPCLRKSVVYGVIPGAGHGHFTHLELGSRVHRNLRLWKHRWAPSVYS